MRGKIFILVLLAAFCMTLAGCETIRKIDSWIQEVLW